MSRSVWLALALAACKGGPDGDEALERLVSQVLEPSGITPDEVVVHEVGHLTPGADLVPAFGADATAPDPLDVPAATTLFLVDRNAGAGWTHEVDWVFLDDEGDARVQTLLAYPVLEGEPFVPEWEPSVWGAPWDPYDPEDFDDEAELAVWEGGAGTPRAAAPPDPCDPPKPRVAVTIAGAGFRAVRNDESNWRRLLGGRGYQTISVVPDGRRPTTRDAILAALRQAVAQGPLEELVIVYSGHGLPDGGVWALGDTLETVSGTVSPADLIRALRGADVDRLTIVAMSCNSGKLKGLPKALKDAGLKATDITLQASSDTDAWIPKDRSGSSFAKALHELVAATLPGDDIPWEGITVPPLVTDTTEGTKPQKPSVAVQARCEPEIGLGTYPTLGGCFAAWLDMLDPDDFDPSQDYGREAMVRGRGFGAATGTLELQQEGGDWVRVPHRFWARRASRSTCRCGATASPRQACRRPSRACSRRRPTSAACPVRTWSASSRRRAWRAHPSRSTWWPRSTSRSGRRWCRAETSRTGWSSGTR
jgi:hypothetical protein